MAAKKRDESEEKIVDINPFEPDLSKVNPEFSLTALLENCKTKNADLDKRKIGLAERISKAKEAISRIQNMIQGLELKGQQASGQTWTNEVVRPIVLELSHVFPAAALDISTVLSGAVTITLSKKGASAAGKLKNVDTKAVTFVPHEKGIGIRDYSKNTGEFPEGSIGAISGYNAPVIPIEPDTALQTIVDWLLK